VRFVVNNLALRQVCPCQLLSHQCCELTCNQVKGKTARLNDVRFVIDGYCPHVCKRKSLFLHVTKVNGTV